MKVLSRVVWHISMGLFGTEPTKPKITALQVATEEYEEAQLDLLKFTKEQEHSTSMVNMLEGRTRRLRRDIVRLSQAPIEDTNVHPLK